MCTSYIWLTDADRSKYCAFEGPEPLYFLPIWLHHYQSDQRGSWDSEGDLTLMSQQEAEDFYDLIEWAGTQNWSSGKDENIRAGYTISSMDLGDHGTLEVSFP